MQDHLLSSIPNGDFKTIDALLKQFFNSCSGNKKYVNYYFNTHDINYLLAQILCNAENIIKDGNREQLKQQLSNILDTLSIISITSTSLGCKSTLNEDKYYKKISKL